MENKSFVVKKASKEDISDMLRITKEAFESYRESAGILSAIPALSDTYEFIENEIENKLCLVAHLDGKVVGSLRLEIKEDGTAYLSRFGVDSTCQSNGVGAGLMKAVDENMKKLGVTKLYLHTASKVFTLIRFYYSKGFYIDSTTKDRGYIRALLCKEYEKASEEYSNCAV